MKQNGTHEDNVDRYLVAQLQGQGNVDEEKMNCSDENDTSLQLCIASLASKMKPRDL